MSGHAPRSLAVRQTHQQSLLNSKSSKSLRPKRKPVHSAQPVTQLDDPFGVQPPLTGNFILVTFTFANNGSEPVTVSDIGLYLYDSEGNQYETEADALMYLPQETSIFLLDRVNPGLTQEVQAVYSVPPTAEGFELEVTSGFFASESARISLGF